MQIPRYVIGAFLFGLIWATIVYTRQHDAITNPTSLVVGVLVITVFGSALSWGLAKLLQWFKNRP